MYILYAYMLFSGSWLLIFSFLVAYRRYQLTTYIICIYIYMCVCIAESLAVPTAVDAEAGPLRNFATSSLLQCALIAHIHNRTHT